MFLVLLILLVELRCVLSASYELLRSQTNCAELLTTDGSHMMWSSDLNAINIDGEPGWILYYPAGLPRNASVANVVSVRPTNPETGNAVLAVWDWRNRWIAILDAYSGRWIRTFQFSMNPGDNYWRINSDGSRLAFTGDGTTPGSYHVYVHDMSDGHFLFDLPGSTEKTSFCISPSGDYYVAESYHLTNAVVRRFNSIGALVASYRVERGDLHITHLAVDEMGTLAMFDGNTGILIIQPVDSDIQPSSHSFQQGLDKCILNSYGRYNFMIQCKQAINLFTLKHSDSPPSTNTIPAFVPPMYNDTLVDYALVDSCTIPTLNKEKPYQRIAASRNVSEPDRVYVWNQSTAFIRSMNVTSGLRMPDITISSAEFYRFNVTLFSFYFVSVVPLLSSLMVMVSDRDGYRWVVQLDPYESRILKLWPMSKSYAYNLDYGQMAVDEQNQRFLIATYTSIYGLFSMVTGELIATTTSSNTRDEPRIFFDAHSQSYFLTDHIELTSSGKNNIVHQLDASDLRVIRVIDQHQHELGISTIDSFGNHLSPIDSLYGGPNLVYTWPDGTLRTVSMFPNECAYGHGATDGITITLTGDVIFWYMDNNLRNLLFRLKPYARVRPMLSSSSSGSSSLSSNSHVSSSSTATNDDKSSSMSSGAIAGIVIGVVGIVLLVGILCVRAGGLKYMRNSGRTIQNSDVSDSLWSVNEMLESYSTPNQEK